MDREELPNDRMSARRAQSEHLGSRSGTEEKRKRTGKTDNTAQKPGLRQNLISIHSKLI